MKSLQPYLVGLVVLLCAFWVWEYGNRRAADAWAEAQADSLRTAHATWEAERDSMAREAERLKLRADSLARQHARAQARYAQLATQTTTYRDSLAAWVGRVDTVMITAAFETLQATVEACDTALSLCQEINLLLESRLVLAAHQDSTTTALLRVTQDRLDAALRTTRPGTLATLWRAAPAIGGAFAVGLLLGR